ncbi:MAG: hypothetical protein GXP42_14275 [Chloroflexi bacterium]|nr:hypothetical protein [Chloroflexota bacterium]
MRAAGLGERLLIIGLDGGTWDVFGPLCDLGEMPHLARLREQSAWGTLLSTQPPFTAPAWATFITGLNPAAHGILNFLQKPSDPARSLRGEGAPVNSTHIRAATLWDYFNAAGRRVASINLPLSYPLRPLEGFAISGMLTPPNADDWTYPRSLARELQDYIIDLDYARAGRILRPQDLPPPSQMLADITRMTERRGFHALRLLQNRQWDVFMVVFTGTDRIFHHFWHYLHTSDEDDIASLDIAVAEGLQAYFHLLDHILAMLTRSVGRETHVAIISDHGFGPAARHWVHLNNWLLEVGVLQLQNAAPGGWIQRMKRQSPWLRDIARRILPADARRAVQRRGHLADAVDWPRTLAWAEPLYNNVAGIYFHRADRFSGGPLAADETPALREHLIGTARALTIPGSDRALVREIAPRESLYDGPYLDRFPDLILTLDPDFAAVPTLGPTLITPARGLIRSGDHRPEGMFAFCGPGISPGHLSSSSSLIDLAPTFLHLAGLAVPESMEGRVIEAALNEGHRQARPIRRGPDLPPSHATVHLSGEEAEAVAQRLRGLGYL